jgi:hypothetical protein
MTWENNNNVKKIWKPVNRLGTDWILWRTEISSNEAVGKNSISHIQTEELC